MHTFNYFVDFVLYTKGVEYLIAVGFLITFILFYAYLKAPASTRQAVAGAVRRISDMIQGFLVPGNLFFHQGHGWAKVESSDVASVGMDDFSQKLMGKIDAVELPEVGSTVRQGEKGWSFQVDSKKIDMLSPVDGKVVAVNEGLRESTAAINEDPYGRGWLLKVQPSKLSTNLRNLFTGTLAGKWTEKVVDDLSAKANYNLGLVLGDGGAPADGMAKSLDAENWDAIVREFLLTQQ